MGGDRRLDLGEFDAVAANLHLPVLAPKEGEDPPRQPASDVAAAVPAMPLRVGDEAPRGLFRVVQIAAPDARAADPDFPRNAFRQGASGGVANFDPRAAQGQADRRRQDFAPTGGGHDVLAGGDAGLGRTVGVDHPRVAVPGDGIEAARQVRRDRLAAQQEGPRRGRGPGLGPVIDQQAEQARRRVAQVDAARLDEGVQAGRIALRLLAGDVDGMAVEQGGEQLLDRTVEGERRDARDVQAALRAQRREQGLADVAGEIDHRAVFDHRALGVAGGAAGENRIGQPVGRGRRRRRRGRRVEGVSAVTELRRPGGGGGFVGADDQVVGIAGRLESGGLDRAELQPRAAPFRRPVGKEGAGDEQVLGEVEKGAVSLSGVFAGEGSQVGQIAVPPVEVPDAARQHRAAGGQQRHRLVEDLPQIGKSREVLDDAVEDDQVEGPGGEDVDVVRRDLAGGHLGQAVGAGMGFHPFDVAAGDVGGDVGGGERRDVTHGEARGAADFQHPRAGAQQSRRLAAGVVAEGGHRFGGDGFPGEGAFPAPGGDVVGGVARQMLPQLAVHHHAGGFDDLVNGFGVDQQDMGQRRALPVQAVQVAGEGGLRDRERRAGQIEDAPPPLQRQHRIDRNVGAPRLHRPQGGGEAAVAVEHQADRGFRRQPQAADEPGDAVRQAVEFGISQRAGFVGDRDAVGERRRHPGEDGGDGLVRRRGVGVWRGGAGNPGIEKQIADFHDRVSVGFGSEATAAATRRR